MAEPARPGASTWRRALAAIAAASGGRADARAIRAPTWTRFLARRAGRSGASSAGLLAIEGAHALDDDLGERRRGSTPPGYRMVGLAHFFDNAFAGSAHGVEKGGLTARRPRARRGAGGRRIVVDLAHASAATIDDVLAIATRPVVASHTGVRGVADNARNLTDEQLRGIAATGGMVGIGFWPTACGGDDAASIARSIAHAVAVVGAEHVGLGSDFDGAVPVPFDASGMGLLTERAPRARPRRGHGRRGHGRNGGPPASRGAAGALTAGRAPARWAHGRASSSAAPRGSSVEPVEAAGRRIVGGAFRGSRGLHPRRPQSRSRRLRQRASSRRPP